MSDLFQIFSLVFSPVLKPLTIKSLPVSAFCLPRRSEGMLIFNTPPRRSCHSEHYTPFPGCGGRTDVGAAENKTAGLTLL